MKRILVAALAGSSLFMAGGTPPGQAQMTANERQASVGDAPADPGPLATNLSGEMKSRSEERR